MMHQIIRLTYQHDHQGQIANSIGGRGGKVANIEIFHLVLWSLKFGVNQRGGWG